MTLARKPAPTEEKPSAKRKKASVRPGQPTSVDAQLPRTTSPLFVNSVAKALNVLQAFAGAHRSMSLSQIATATKLDLSAAQRFAYTLHALGYLRKDTVTKHYELSPRVLDFGFNYVRSSDLVERATPYLRALNQQFEETTNLTILDETDVVFVSRFVSHHVISVDVVVGMRLPVFCTAPGLAILSSLERDDAIQLLERSDLHAYTPYTVTDLDAIVGRLDEIRMKGYALTSEETFIGDISIASPVLDAAGRGIGAINIAVSTSRWNAQDAEKTFASTLRAAAGAASYTRGKR